MPNTLQMNEQQYQAVTFTDGAMELIAGPGSGKTFVITHRLEHLIKEHKVAPSSILVITFTKAAASEMRERFCRLIGTNETGIQFGTFHAIYFQIIKTNRNFQNVSLITEHQKYEIIKELLLQLKLEDLIDSESIMQITKMISENKNQLDNSMEKKETDFSFHYENNSILTVEQFQFVFKEYESILKELKKIDFEDMVLQCYYLLQKDQELLEYYQKKIQYILIDEFQDINNLQYEVIKMIARPRDNLFVVGDDDQSIYGFRGANPEIMRRFLSDYPSAKQIFLSINYRSTKSIVSDAVSVINENKNRFFKNIQSNNELGKEVFLLKSTSKEEQFRILCCKIKEQLANEIEYSEIAVLFRTNREAKEFSKFLELENIPYSHTIIPENIYQKKYVQDILDYLRFANGDKRRSIFFRIMNKPLRYIKRDSCPKEEIQKNDLLYYYQGNERMIRAIEILFEQFEKLKSLKPYLAINYVRKVIGYDIYQKQELKEMDYDEYIRNISAFQNNMKKYGSFEQLFADMDLLKKKEIEPVVSEGIRLMTYHGSKGLEFHTVLLPNLNEGIVPPKQSRTDELVEEERRMFYVAMTRAKKELFIAYIENKKDIPSRFLRRIMK